MKKKKTASNRMLMIGILLVVIALIGILFSLWEYRREKNFYDNLSEKVCQLDGEMDDAFSDSKDTSQWKPEKEVDFSYLKEQNPDIIGWIYFGEGNVIDYPILYAEDNATYLRKDLYGDYSISGSVFLEAGNNPDFSDKHSILYGHNMKNRTMFGSLRNYKSDESYYQKYPDFTILTPTKAYHYRIFSYHDVSETDTVYTIGYAETDTFQDFIDDLVKKSYLDTGIHPQKTDQIMTLSTCSTKGKRFVLHAVLEDVYVE